MIGYLEGSLFKKRNDRIILLTGGVGYEILLPQAVAEGLAGAAPGDAVGLFIYWHQTERSPKPLLIGFLTEEEREFFEIFLTVEDIGPTKAVAALCLPICEIAQAVESRDSDALKRMKGIGRRTADKIVATLNGKLSRFLAPGPEGPPRGAPEPAAGDPAAQVMDILVHRLGHTSMEARDMIAKALARRPDIASPEELFDEVYRGRA